MQIRRSVRGARRPVVIDLLLAVVVASVLMAGVRAVLDIEEGAQSIPIGLASLGVIPLLAWLYGASAAMEMRRGWLGASYLSGLLHLGLVVASAVGIATLAVLSPTAASLLILAEATILLWSSSWI